MFVASNKSSSNPLESYTPDLLQRELNSRFLQTANNYTENKPNKIGTTATTNAPPLLQPYLNLNKNEATNLYASQSIFNPMVNIDFKIIVIKENAHVCVHIVS